MFVERGWKNKNCSKTLSAGCSIKLAKCNNAIIQTTVASIYDKCFNHHLSTMPVASG